LADPLLDAIRRLTRCGPDHQCVGTKPNTGMIMKPLHGKWGDDLMMVMDDEKGFWIKDGGSATWTPSPTQYGPRKVLRGTPKAR